MQLFWVFIFDSGPQETPPKIPHGAARCGRTCAEIGRHRPQVGRRTRCEVGRWPRGQSDTDSNTAWARLALGPKSTKSGVLADLARIRLNLVRFRPSTASGPNSARFGPASANYWGDSDPWSKIDIVLFGVSACLRAEARRALEHRRSVEKSARQTSMARFCSEWLSSCKSGQSARASTRRGEKCNEQCPPSRRCSDSARVRLRSAPVASPDSDPDFRPLCRRNPLLDRGFPPLRTHLSEVCFYWGQFRAMAERYLLRNERRWPTWQLMPVWPNSGSPSISAHARACLGA